MAEAKEKTTVRKQQKLTGLVSSTGGDNTIHVVVENLVKHPRYGKYVRCRTKVAAHDPESQAEVGDMVEIISCRRISKTKAFRLSKIVREATLTTKEAASDKG